MLKHFLSLLLFIQPAEEKASKACEAARKAAANAAHACVLAVEKCTQTDDDTACAVMRDVCELMDRLKAKADRICSGG